MPIATSKSDTQEVGQGRRDSTFTYEQTPSHPSAEEMDRLSAAAALRSLDHSRTASVDSGIGGMAGNQGEVSSPLVKKAEHNHSSIK